jgi:hypothetical protein
MSVIVIPLIGGDTLASYLDRLALNPGECIVVLRSDMGGSAEWGRRYPSVIFVDSADQTVPARRKRGVELATGDVVALIEDTSWPAEGWYAAVRNTFTDMQTAAAGGAVIISSLLPSRYRALGWIEYGAFSKTPAETPPCPADCDASMPVSRVAGNNMAFRRLELLEVLRDDHAGLVEEFVCDQLQARGNRIVFQPRMIVTYAACDCHGATLATRMHHGRIYASTRSCRNAALAGVVHLVKACLLPIVLTARTARFMSSGGRVSVEMPTLFWLVLMACAWALGEGVGVIAGPGKSMLEWR